MSRFIFISLLAYASSLTELVPFTPYQDPVSLSSFSRNIGGSQVILVIGGDGGGVSFWDVYPDPPVLIKSLTVSSARVSQLVYNTVSDLLAVISPANKLIVYGFSNIAGFVPGATLVLQNMYTIDAVAWNQALLPATPHLAIGSRSGVVDEYLISMPTTAVSQALTATNINRRWFVGCPINYIAYTNPTNLVVGCSTGQVVWLQSSAVDPPSSVPIAPVSSIELKTPISDFIIAKYTKAGMYLVALLELTVYIVDLTTRTLHSTVDILTYVTPLSPNRAERVVRSISAHLNPVTNIPSSLVVRTTESILQFDITQTMAGTQNFWTSGIDVANLISTQSLLHHSNPVRVVTPDNQPYVSVSVADGAIDFVPCYNAVAQAAQVGDLSNIFCTLGPLNVSRTSSHIPIISLEITLSSPFTKIRGSFNLQSSGTLPAQDCSLQKQPISSWYSDQQSSWSLLTPAAASTTGQLSSICDSLTFWLTEPITSLAKCQNACTNISSCNLVFFNSQTKFCEFRTCSSRPSSNLLPPTNIAQAWFLSSMAQLSTSFYGGYVAFGTESSVVYGGCQSPNGLIPTDSAISITIPETDLGSLQTVIRFQVSQYTADARIRLSQLDLDFFSPYLSPLVAVAEPANMPGEFIYPIRDPRPGTNDAPLTLSPDGLLAITTNRRGYIGFFNLENN